MKVDDVPPIHTMNALGQMGRFGNQVFQYAFLRICARQSGTSIQCSPWVGQKLFGHADPPVSVSLKPLVEKGSNLEWILEVVPEFTPYLEKTSGMEPGEVGIDAIAGGCEPGDLIGFFQWHSKAYLPHREYFRSLFQPCDDMRDWLDEPIRRMRARGKTIVAIHLRTGDYRWLPQFSWTMVVPPQWWADWLDTVWDKLDRPVLYLCSNDVASVRHWFAKFDPVTSEDMTVGPPLRLQGSGSGFYLDYYVMTQADVLGASNSSFSFSAAMLNERGSTFVRPSWDFSKKFTEFDPWDAEPLLFLRGGRKRLLKPYPTMLRIARDTSGIAGALAAALLYHPVGSLTVLAIRAKLAWTGHGWRGVRDMFLGRGRA